MAIQKRSTKSGKTRWVARYRDHAGKEHSKSFDTQREAKAFLQEQERSLRRGEWVDPKQSRITVQELMEQWIERPMRENSRSVYEQTLANLGPLAEMPILQLTRVDVDGWYKQLLSHRPWRGPQDKGVSETTARAMVAHLSSLAKYGVELGILTKNVVKVPRSTGKGSRAVQRSQLPTVEQIRAVADYLERGVQRRSNPSLAAMVICAAGTGMRASELCGLQVQSVDFLHRRVHVTAQMDSRGRGLAPLKTTASERTLPVSEETLMALDKMCAGKQGDEWVFTNLSGGTYRLNTVTAPLRRAVLHVGADFTFHGLRHFYASRLIDAGLSVAAVQRLMGHESAALTLSTYTHLFPDAEEQARAAVQGILEPRGIDAGSRGGGASLRGL
ncbi:Tyrosine recombinase XerC [Corynebacterium ciconiae DSM 44920]|uniref:tyrosine-type recombinase/integrase n=1 Tax=Corynebacterium ciconiae TaxID=227319 RepID=UPI00037FCB9B|nr:site-specific integrase [Corynebacterium ciconiae]WKD60880.1 Tyrosine recombinase XerC [Corynebacterium ciconiae DSM 44920]